VGTAAGKLVPKANSQRDVVTNPDHHGVTIPRICGHEVDWRVWFQALKAATVSVSGLGVSSALGLGRVRPGAFDSRHSFRWYSVGQTSSSQLQRTSVGIATKERRCRIRGASYTVSGAQRQRFGSSTRSRPTWERWGGKVSQQRWDWRAAWPDGRQLAIGCYTPRLHADRRICPADGRSRHAGRIDQFRDGGRSTERTQTRHGNSWRLPTTE